MSRAKASGWLLMLLCLVSAVSLLVGVFYRSYWALAIPVILSSLGALALGFWVGWTMATTETEPPLQPPDAEES